MKNYFYHPNFMPYRIFAFFDAVIEAIGFTLNIVPKMVFWLAIIIMSVVIYSFYADNDTTTATPLKPVANAELIYPLAKPLDKHKPWYQAVDNKPAVHSIPAIPAKPDAISKSVKELAIITMAFIGIAILTGVMFAISLFLMLMERARILFPRLVAKIDSIVIKLIGANKLENM